MPDTQQIQAANFYSLQELIDALTDMARTITALSAGEPDATHANHGVGVDGHSRVQLVEREVAGVRVYDVRFS